MDAREKRRYNTAMYTKRLFAAMLCLILLLSAVGFSALAEGEETGGEAAEATADPAAPAAEEATADPDAPAPVDPSAPAVDDGSGTVDAALCARVLRAGEGSEAYESWLRTLAHAPHVCIRQKVGRAILKCALDLETQTPSDEPLYLVTCSEAPLPGNGTDAYRSQQFNLHGTVYSVNPITAVTVSIKHRGITGGIYPVTATVSFDASENRTAYSLDEEVLVGDDYKSLDSLTNFSRLKTGKHVFSILVTTTAAAEPVTLYEENFEVLNERPTLTQNAFRDNYSTALRFFGGDTSKFLMSYTWRSQGKRDINTAEVWRNANIVKSSLGRVHIDAVSNFEQANDYLQSSYIRVSVNGAEGKVLQLARLVDRYATYVPRFQSDLRLISHHTFGTAIDVNDKYGANLNNAENWNVIGAAVREDLVYNGIQTDGDGQQYYDFTFTGDAGAKADGVPKSIVNYLIYELAFFRAGFNWGYYYDHTCDAMHFSLTDGEHYRHMDSEIGLRKVFEYYD